MRISVDKRDIGYRFDIDLRNVRVYLNGVLFTRAVTADEEQNMIVALKYDENSKPIIDEEKQAYVLEIIKGDVKIEVLGDDGLSIRNPKVLIERTNEGIEVLVYSRVRPNNIRRHLLFNSTIGHLNNNQIAQACGLAAGAAAEYLSKQFGDIFDPSEAAFTGVETCKYMLATEEQVTCH